MKVIKHGDTKSTTPEIVTKRITCPICGCEFEYGSDETWHNEYKQTYVLCPECSGHCMEEEKMSLNNPPHFPEHFYDFNGGVPQRDQTINDWIREATDYFRTHPEDPLKFIACGDSILFAVNMDDGDIHLYVAKGYYEASID